MRSDSAGAGAGRRGAIPPAALNEGLFGWMILFKDLLKKTSIAHDEARLLLGSLAFLRVYRWRQSQTYPPDGQRSIFDGQFSSLAQIVAELRHLQEEVRDELVLVQLLLLDERRYEDLSDPRLGAGVLARPKAQTTLRAMYVAALRVLWTTDFSTAARAVPGALKRKKWGTEALLADTLRTISEVHTRRQEEQRAPAAEGAPPPEPFLAVSMRLEIVKLLTLLQEQPYCQPERIEGGRPEHDLVTDMREWIVKTASDGRLAEIMLQAARVPGIPLLEDCVTGVYEREWTLQDVVKRALSGGGAGAGQAAAPWQELIWRWAARVRESASKRVGTPAASLLTTVARDEVCLVLEDLVDLIVEIGEACWHTRMAGILDRLARTRQGDIVEVGGSALSPIHGYFFGRVAHYHERCDDAFAALRRMVQSTQQRGSVLPPSFPAVPRLHRREREAVESMLLGVLDRMRDNTARVFRLFRRTLPALTVELSLEYAFTSEVRIVRPARGVRAAIAIVPFFLLEMPRYMAEVVHEIAHAYISNDEIEGAVASADWDRRVAAILRVTGHRLHECYLAHGVPHQDEWGLVAEVMADLVALLVVGPYYVYSLLFATIGLADLPLGPGEKPVLHAEVEINPMVRIGVLFACVRALALDDPDGATGLFSEPRLEPVEAIWRAYFNLFHDRAGEDWREAQRLEIFREEIQILTEGFVAIVDRLVRLVHVCPKCGASYTEDVVSCARDDTRLTRQEACLPQLLRRSTGDEATSGRDLGRWRWAEIALRRLGVEDALDACVVVGSKQSVEAEFMKDNLIHGMWSAVLAEPWKAGRAFADERDEAQVCDALWRRASEVRRMIALLTGTEMLRPPKWRPQLRLKRPPKLEPGDVVTVVQADAFWFAGNDAAESVGIGVAADDVAQHGGRWVIGDHDFHFQMRRDREGERLGRPVSRMLALLPVQPRYCYLRESDYWVRLPPRGRAKRAEAFFQLRLEPTGGRAIPMPDEFAEIVDAVGTEDASRTGCVLQSIGWDHYALTVGFESFSALSGWWHTLRRELAAKCGMAVGYHTMSILHRPRFAGDPSDRALAKQRPEVAPEVAFVTRIRCASGRLQDDDTRRRLDEECKRCSTRARATWAEASGHDDLELRLAVWARRSSEGARDATRASLQLHTLLVGKVILITRAFDAQTTVLLPRANDGEV